MAMPWCYLTHSRQLPNWFHESAHAMDLSMDPDDHDMIISYHLKSLVFAIVVCNLAVTVVRSTQVPGNSTVQYNATTVEFLFDLSV